MQAPQLVGGVELGGAGSLAEPLRPQSAGASSSRGPAFFADFELPLTSAAASVGSPAAASATRVGGTPASAITSASTPSVDGPPSPMGFGVNTPMRSGLPAHTAAYTPSSPHDFASSVGDFVGAAGGASGETPLDKRLQNLKLPHKMATDAATAAAYPSTPNKGGEAARAPAPGRPIWQSLAFIDLFADAAGGARAALLATDGPPRGAVALSASFRFVSRLLRTLGKESSAAAAADTTFLSSHDAAGPLPELSQADEGFRLGLELIALQRTNGEHEALLSYLEQLVPMITALPVGGEVCAPAARASRHPMRLPCTRANDASRHHTPFMPS